MKFEVVETPEDVPGPVPDEGPGEAPVPAGEDADPVAGVSAAAARLAAGARAERDRIDASLAGLAAVVRPRRNGPAAHAPPPPAGFRADRFTRKEEQ